VAGDPTIIQASFGGQKASVTLVVKAPPNLTGVVILTPSSINVGAFSTGTVTINRPAPSKGFVVAVRSGDPAIAEVQQANVTVDPGKTTATFQVRGRAPSGDQGVDIIAQAGNVTVTGNLVVRTRKTLGKIESKERLGKEVGSKEGAAAIEKLPSGREVISPFTRTINKLTEALGPNLSGSALPDLGASASGPMAQAFILAEERPPAGEAVLNPPASPEAEPEVMPGVNPEATPAGDGSLSVSARSIGKRAVDRAAPKRKPKSIEKPVAPEKGTIAEDLGKRPI